MEDISDICSRLTLEKKDWFDNSNIGLYIVDERVYTPVNIQQGQFIGYIIGTIKYIWDVMPHTYSVPIDDMYCIDCNVSPRCITSMLRKDKDIYNCIIAYSYNNEKTDAYIISIKPIYGGNELICNSHDTIFDNC